jgi:alpha-mannosidase
MTADRGKQEFTYAFHAWNGSFFDSDVVREAYGLNVPVTTVAGCRGEGSLFTVSAPNVIVETVKAAEDGSGDVVVRLYEAKHAATRCALRTSLPAAKACEVNMLEEGGVPVAIRKGEIVLDFRPFEIKTVRLTVK